MHVSIVHQADNVDGSFSGTSVEKMQQRGTHVRMSGGYSYKWRDRMKLHHLRVLLLLLDVIADLEVECQVRFKPRRLAGSL